MEKKREEILDQDEIRRVIDALLRGQGPVSEEQIRVAVAWASDARLRGALLEGILGGIFVFVFKDGELAFDRADHQTEGMRQEATTG